MCSLIVSRVVDRTTYNIGIKWGNELVVTVDGSVGLIKLDRAAIDLK